MREGVREGGGEGIRRRAPLDGTRDPLLGGGCNVDVTLLRPSLSTPRGRVQCGL